MRKIFILIFIFAVGFFMPGDKSLPQFVEHTIATDVLGGYQVIVTDLNKDGKPDLIALGSSMSELVWYENPGWQRHVIAGGFTKMINLVIIESGPHPVIVMATNFSSEPKNSLGIVSVLEPENGDIYKPWKVKEIDRLPTSHRLRLADIDGSGNKVVINAPLSAADASSPDYKGHIPLVYYKPGEWKRHLIGDENEGVMHGICIIDWDNDGRDEILTASFVGIHLYKFLPNNKWTRTEIAKGNPTLWPKSGSSDLAIGNLGNQRFLCSIEPWHGNQVVVYREEKGKWVRQVIEESFKEGHALLTADLNNDGKDEIIAGYRLEGGGAFIYTADDDNGLHWTRHDLDRKISAASCAVVDLNGDGKPDITCIGSATADLKWYENK